APVAFRRHFGPLMGMSFLEFRYTKPFFQKNCFFCGAWKPTEVHFCGFSSLMNTGDLTCGVNLQRKVG
ncbi:hypothetical protein, partial [Chryseobacterium koreense]